MANSSVNLFEHESRQLGINFLNNFNFSLSPENKSVNITLDDFTTEVGIGLGSNLPPGPGGDESTWTSLGWGDVALVSLFCCIIGGTVVGNTLVIAAVITTRRLRTVTNCFVMSLAVADWLVGVFVMPPKVALFFVHNEWRLGGFLCELWIALDILLCTASILSLCAISIDRYLAITRPLAYSRKRRSKRLALSMISCVWVAAAIITSPPIFGWYDETRNVENKCEYNENTGYVVYSALGSFFLPLFVMLYVYARIACVIATRQDSIQRLSNMSDKRSTNLYAGSDSEPLREHPNTQSARLPEQSPLGQRDIEEGLRPEDLIDPRSSRPKKAKAEGRKLSRFWGLIQCAPCAGNMDEESQSENEAKGGCKKGGRLSSESESNSASGIAATLPDPSTLNNLGGGNNSGGGPCPSVSPSSRYNGNTNNAMAQLMLHSSRISRTGSRLCHHSIATTSPQKNIYRTTSSTARLFLDHELVPLDESGSLQLSKSTPRVWTVEETSASQFLGVEDPVHPSTKSTGRGTSFKIERGRRGNTRYGDSTSPKPGMGVVGMVNTPAGNPASLMSSQNVTNVRNSIEEQSSTHHGYRATCLSNKSHYTHPSSHYNPPHVTNNTSGSTMHRGRSLKLTLNLHGNGSTATRDFSSGRVASFKRETKTAQTLAAVVGGFIICWLPFFVAYVIGPFIPDTVIPSALMDALIWLGWSNSTINPFIYAFYSPDFRSAFWRLTVKKCGGGRSRREGLYRSPRRFDDHHNTQSRISG